MKRREALRNTVLAGGSALATPTLLSLLQSCQNTPHLNWKPQFLTAEEAQFISVLVDTWLPKTETPGALDVNVHIFLDRVFSMLYDDDTRSWARSEIEKINKQSEEGYGNLFASLSDDDRVELMRELEKSPGKYTPGVWGTPVGKQEPIPFYRHVKSLALWAYFSSEQVGENVMSYDPIPGDYKGCIPLSEVGKSWSL